uniref:Uncharacterized protein n=1 Tax=Cannabis sativa TaxID=3483 RepID=A0A803QHT6_CANSA
MKKLATEEVESVERKGEVSHNKTGEGMAPRKKERGKPRKQLQEEIFFVSKRADYDYWRFHCILLTMKNEEFVVLIQDLNAVIGLKF